jgi:DNA (cytosine-5)-methyltransferase 1
MVSSTPNIAIAQQDLEIVEITTILVREYIYMLVGEGGNIGVGVGEEGVFLIDDQFAPLTEKIRTAVGKISQQPIRFLINTHYHFDHTGGNENMGALGMAKVNHRPIGIDLFAGAGGMTLGFEQAGFDIPLGVEIDPIHCATHQFNFPFWSVICASVTDITGEEIRKLGHLENQDIDVVFGGPPCQGFSMIGKRNLEDPRNSLMFDFVRLVLELQPKYLVIENVKGLTSHRHKIFLEEIIVNLEFNGYQVTRPIKVLNAANYGVPQNRERLFIVGSRRDLPLIQYPQPLSKPPKISRNEPLNLLPKTPTVWEAIADLPEVEKYPELLTKDWIVAEYKHLSHYAKILHNLEDIPDNYSYPRTFDYNILTSSLRTNHSAQVRQRFFTTEPGKKEPISRFYKLHPERLSNTLRAGTPSNKGAHTSPRPIHPFTPRCITVREAARLHAYPDWFRFHVTKWHGFRQIGNSVPPLLAKAIASEIIKALNIQPARPLIKYQLGNPLLLALNMTDAAKFYGVIPHQVIS